MNLREIVRRPRVFISYRREDAPYARELYGLLVRVFGRRNVFIDLENIATGERFWALIEKELRASDVAVALIGPRWRDTSSRLHDPNDFVRREIELALARGVRLLPVRMGGAAMPAAHDLPTSIRELALVHAAEIRVAEAATDTARVMRVIDPHVVRRQARLLAGAACVVVLAAWANACDIVRADSWSERVVMSLGDALAPGTPSDQVVVVPIDAATVARVGRKFDATWRAEHARLLDVLSEAGAAAVAFDFNFGRPTPADPAFREAIDRAVARRTRVVLGTKGGLPPPPLDASRARVGILCSGKHPTVLPLAVLGPSEAVPTRLGLSLLAAFPFDRVALEERSRWDAVSSRPRLRLYRDGEPREAVEASFKEVPFADVMTSQREDCGPMGVGDLKVNLLVRLSPPDAWKTRRIPYEEVLFGDAPTLDPRLRGRIILIGRLTDEAEPPEDQDWFTTIRGFHAERHPGVEIHAEAVSHLVAGTAIAPAHELFSMIAAAFAAWLGFGIRRRERERSRSWIGLTLAGLAFLATAALVYAAIPIVLNTSYPLAGLLVGYWATGRLAPVLAPTGRRA